jgi:hypothetical protein
MYDYKLIYDHAKYTSRRRSKFISANKINKFDKERENEWKKKGGRDKEEQNNTDKFCACETHKS